MLRVLVSAVLSGLSVAIFLAEVDASADRVSILAQWYDSVGGPLRGENFGRFVSRVAQARIDTPYAEAAEGEGPEAPALELDHFECVSFLEASLAVARCAWQNRPTEECFVWESVGLRYRGGIVGGYSSRLHYFVDWLEVNDGRERLRDVTAELGGRPIRREFSYLTRRAGLLPALTSTVEQKALRAVERDLSSRPHWVVPAPEIRAASEALRDGDLVGVAGNKSGRLVIHAGLVVRRDAGKARLLHASSYHRRVVVTREDIAAYVARRPERTGILIARPVAP